MATTNRRRFAKQQRNNIVGAVLLRRIVSRSSSDIRPFTAPYKRPGNIPASHVEKLESAFDQRHSTLVIS
jgi:hypothetical protein